MPLPVRYNAVAAIRYGRRHVDPPGANDWTRSSVGNPVVMVHGLAGSAAASWFSLSPLLVNSGRSAFALDYGDYGHGVLTRRASGVGDAERCAAEVSDFVERVRAATGASTVDLVGHSMGALVIQYYVKRLGGSAVVDRVVGIAPTFHGTTFNGLLRLPAGPRVGAWLLGENIVQQAAGSPFLQALYADGDTAPGVTYTVVSPRWDTITTPVRSQRLEGPGTTNLRMGGFAEHMLLVYSRAALGHVLRALGEPPSVSEPRSRSARP